MVRNSRPPKRLLVRVRTLGIHFEAEGIESLITLMIVLALVFGAKWVDSSKS